MDEDPQRRDLGSGDDLSRKIGRKAQRRARARRTRNRGIWFGLGAFGVIGWSVAIPTLLGVALGVWLDKYHPGPLSWTLTCLFLGLLLGCWNAWYWVLRERRSIEESEQDEQPEARQRE